MGKTSRKFMDSKMMMLYIASSVVELAKNGNLGAHPLFFHQFELRILIEVDDSTYQDRCPVRSGAKHLRPQG